MCCRRLYGHPVRCRLLHTMGEPIASLAGTITGQLVSVFMFSALLNAVFCANHTTPGGTQLTLGFRRHFNLSCTVLG